MYTIDPIAGLRCQARNVVKFILGLTAMANGKIAVFLLKTLNGSTKWIIGALSFYAIIGRTTANKL